MKKGVENNKGDKLPINIWEKGGSPGLAPKMTKAQLDRAQTIVESIKQAQERLEKENNANPTDQTSR